MYFLNPEILGGGSSFVFLYPIIGKLDFKY